MACSSVAVQCVCVGGCVCVCVCVCKNLTAKLVNALLMIHKSYTL